MAQEILPGIADRAVLYLALFLHDIAKGRMEDHSLAGVAVARKLCPRFGLDEARTETVAWLIAHHLVMSDTAQRRDLSDFRTIETFARLVGTTERLDLLLVLTICDIRAVGPGVWNGWKSELLRTLYLETESLLEGERSTVARERRVGAAREELRQALLPRWDPHDFDAYAARHQPSYWLKVDLAHKVRHAAILNMSEVETPAPVVASMTDAARGITELTVIAPDHPRLLSTIAGACAAAAADIVDAQVFTTIDGLALDLIYVTRAFEHDEDELRRAGRIALAIERALTGEIRLAELVAKRDGGANATDIFDVEPTVAIDNTLSNRFTVVEVAGLDRRGLLFALTSVFSQLNLNISSAYIATFGEKAADVFYVTDLAGGKIGDAARKAAIRDAILDVLKVRHARLPETLGL